VVLKLSGEALASAASDETIDASTVDFLASEIARAMERGNLELAVVVVAATSGAVPRRDGRHEPREL